MFYVSTLRISSVLKSLISRWVRMALTFCSHRSLLFPTMGSKKTTKSEANVWLRRFILFVLCFISVFMSCRFERRYFCSTCFHLGVMPSALLAPTLCLRSQKYGYLAFPRVLWRCLWFARFVVQMRDGWEIDFNGLFNTGVADQKANLADFLNVINGLFCRSETLSYASSLHHRHSGENSFCTSDFFCTICTKILILQSFSRLLLRYLEHYILQMQKLKTNFWKPLSTAPSRKIDPPDEQVGKKQQRKICKERNSLYSLCNRFLSRYFCLLFGFLFTGFWSSFCHQAARSKRFVMIVLAKRRLVLVSGWTWDSSYSKRWFRCMHLGRRFLLPVKYELLFLAVLLRSLVYPIASSRERFQFGCSHSNFQVALTSWVVKGQ